MTQALGTGKGLEAMAHMTPQTASQSSHEFFFSRFSANFGILMQSFRCRHGFLGMEGLSGSVFVQLSPLHDVSELWLLNYYGC